MDAPCFRNRTNMPFFKSCMGKGKNCMGKGKKRAAKLRAKLLQKELDGSPAISLRLLLIDKQVDAEGVIPAAALKVRSARNSGWSDAIAHFGTDSPADAPAAPPCSAAPTNAWRPPCVPCVPHARVNVFT